MILPAIALALAVASAGPATTTDAEKRLVSFSISDQAEHRPVEPEEFRRVHLSTLKHPDGAIRPLLCGEMRVRGQDGAQEWIAFAALETGGDGYEQWVGGPARVWCNVETVLDQTRDFSPEFTRRLVKAK